MLNGGLEDGAAHVMKYDFVFHSVTHSDAAIKTSDTTAKMAKGKAEDHCQSLVMSNRSKLRARNALTILVLNRIKVRRMRPHIALSVTRSVRGTGLVRDSWRLTETECYSNGSLVSWMFVTIE